MQPNSRRARVTRVLSHLLMAGLLALLAFLGWLAYGAWQFKDFPD